MAAAVERPRGAAGAWALTLVAALGGYLWIVAPADRELAAARARVRALIETGDRDEEIVRRASAPPGADLAQALPPWIFARRTGPQATLAALQAFASEATRRHVAIASFAPADASDHQRSGEQDVALSLQGKYADVLETVAELSSGPVLFDIRGLVLTQASDQMDWQGVDATVDGALFASATDVFESGKENQRMYPGASSSSALRIARDPFGMPPGPPPAQGPPALPGMAALPPNAGAGAPVLRAIIDGAPPRALLEVGDRPLIVRVGSHLGFATVTAISASEVRLDDGRTLRLAGTP